MYIYIYIYIYIYPFDYSHTGFRAGRARALLAGAAFSPLVRPAALFWLKNMRYAGLRALSLLFSARSGPSDEDFGSLGRRFGVPGLDFRG